MKVGDIVLYGVGKSFGMKTLHWRPGIVVEARRPSLDDLELLVLQVFIGGLDLKQMPAGCHSATEHLMVVHAQEQGDADRCWKPCAG